jgi:glycosyltransferase involved in cell wall biosynthesis
MYFDVFPWLDMNKTFIAHDAANTPAVAVDNNGVCIGRSAALQVGYVGSFQIGCGITLIADIAALLPDEDFHVFGGNPADVEEWVLRTSEIENLKFHGFIAPGRLSEIYESMDLMVAPYQATTRSIQWASPMKIFEYLAHEKAIICSDFPVFREVLENGVTAILVHPDRPNEWVRAIQDLAHDHELRKQLGNAGRESLRRYHTWRKRAERILTEERSDLGSSDSH